ncbi:MAG: D-glycero-beta-D-manno-heptose-7-phosphate kinase [Ignavibacterium sp.]|nr:D-glycero-beta-D-manno-heptose-7-phosphate kinase [Ignavibacterium sp.]MCX7611684.1 D-glycero-beta-D-manno-heptose-7-phosphate kinase [Ignavibacterium sp.]MDW8375732.1 D-glycero-beta-D-manno-heptose-7-phosphate kinase [Ignavibacteriales bacterium]
MLIINKKELKRLKNNFYNKKIGIIGDMMLDVYFRGEVKRISPEAPVPVIEIDSEIFRFGGAANCALNILTLGGIPFPVGVIGNDSNGSIFNSLLKEYKIDTAGILIDEDRPTTTKTRVISDSQHIVRIDKEHKNYINSSMEKKLLDYVKSIIKDLDGIILQDYNKGVLTPKLIKEIISLANKNNVLITVDPKFNNFFLYKNVTLFKPNRKEAEDVLGIKIKSESDISKAGNLLLKKLKSKYILLTLGEGGVAIFQEGMDEFRIPTKARKVADVSGAGDTVISTLTIAMAAGADILKASYLANYAGGLVCEEVGIVPIELDKLFNEVINERNSL